MEVVRCIKCGENKIADDFTLGQLNGRKQCKSCVSLIHRAKRLEKSIRLGSEQLAYSDWEQNLKSKFNLTPEKWFALLDAQNGKCAICEVDQCSSGRKFAVDHDHSCCPTIGKCCGECVRGLLCLLCNTLVGKIEMNRQRTVKALEYIGWGEQS
jgi:hypothetical protein